MLHAGDCAESFDACTGVSSTLLCRRLFLLFPSSTRSADYLDCGRNHQANISAILGIWNGCTATTLHFYFTAPFCTRPPSFYLPEHPLCLRDPRAIPSPYYIRLRIHTAYRMQTVMSILPRSTLILSGLGARCRLSFEAARLGSLSFVFGLFSSPSLSFSSLAPPSPQG